MSAAYPVPAWRVTLDGQDLTDRIRPRLLSLTLTETRGGEADQLDLTLHDHDGRMALPVRGVLVQVAIGWASSGLVEKGSFTVDEVEHRGSPDTITLRGRSADLTQDMRNRRDRSWHDTTLGEVLDAIAGENGLEPRVDPGLAATELQHLDQVGESDAQLLTRLGQRFDAVATVKAGSLLFLPVGAGESASGEPLPAARITRASGDQHAWSAVDREKYTGVRAYWHDQAEARNRSVVAGLSGNAKRIRRIFPNETQAREHAESEWSRLQRGEARLSYRLALGRADLYPEQHVTVAGFKPEIDGTDWLIVRATHSIDANGGFTTALEMETGHGAEQDAAD